ncbi:unnamed protein product [Sphacelaria rigidula]
MGASTPLLHPKEHHEPDDLPLRNGGQNHDAIPEAQSVKLQGEDVAMRQDALVHSSATISSESQKQPERKNSKADTETAAAWTVRHDRESGYDYYVHLETQATSWERPVLSAAITANGRKDADDGKSISAATTHDVHDSAVTDYVVERTRDSRVDEQQAPRAKQGVVDQWTPSGNGPIAAPSSTLRDGEKQEGQRIEDLTAGEDGEREVSSSPAADDIATLAVGSGSDAASSEGSWVEVVDPDSGQTYFYNAVTQESAWKPPEGSVEVASAAAFTAVGTQVAEPGEVEHRSRDEGVGGELKPSASLGNSFVYPSYGGLDDDESLTKR